MLNRQVHKITLAKAVTMRSHSFVLPSYFSAAFHFIKLSTNHRDFHVPLDLPVRGHLRHIKSMVEKTLANLSCYRDLFWTCDQWEIRSFLWWNEGGGGVTSLESQGRAPRGRRADEHVGWQVIKVELWEKQRCLMSSFKIKVYLAVSKVSLCFPTEKKSSYFLTFHKTVFSY